MFWLVSGDHVGVPQKDTKMAAPYIFLPNMSNTYLPITLEQNAFGLQNLAQKCSFKSFTIPQTFWNRNLLFTASEFWYDVSENHQKSLKENAELNSSG